MGSRSKSSSSSATTNNNLEYTLSEADYSQGDGSRTSTTTAGTGNTVTVNTTDFGAIEGGLKLGADALAGAFKFGSDSLEGALSVVDTSAQRTTQAIAGLAAQQERSNADTIGKVLAIQEQRTTDGTKQIVKLLAGLGLTAAAAAVLVVYLKSRK